MASKKILTLLGTIAIAIAIPTVTIANPYKRQEQSQTTEEIIKTVQEITGQKHLNIIDDNQSNFINFNISNSYEKNQDVTISPLETKNENTPTYIIFGGIVVLVILEYIVIRVCGGCIRMILVAVLIISVIGLLSYFFIK